MADIYDWSTTAADNDDADATINWLEGQLPGTVNGSARAMMKRVKELLNDVSASGTVAGTADAITLTSAIGALADNKMVRFIAASSNTGAATLAVNGLTAKAIRKISGGTDVALSAGDIAAGETYLVMYRSTANGAAGGWVIVGSSAAITFSTNAQAVTGTSTVLAVNPANLGSLLNAGSDNSGGATITMGDGGYFNLVTSTTAITAFAFTNDAVGRTARVRFDTVRTLTHNATSLIIPGAANITTAQGDIAQIRSLGSGNFVVEWYRVASSAPPVATPWVAYTPVFTGLGTVTNINFRSRRSGANLEIIGGGTAGTSTAVEARMTIGFNGTSANVTSASFLPALVALGDLGLSVANNATYRTFIETSKTYITFGVESLGGLTKATGEAVFDTGRAFAFHVSIPIEGW